MMFDLLRQIIRFEPQHPVIAGNHATFKKFDQDRPLTEYSFVVLDTELTGLDRRRDEIVSIGAVGIHNLQIDLGRTFHAYVRPARIDHNAATLVHRITPEQMRHAAPLEKVLPEFLDFIDKDLLVGHCIGLDMSFLHRATKKMFRGTLVTPCIDTMRLARAYKRVLLGRYYDLDLQSDGYRLIDLSKEFKLPLFEAHDALEDALQTAYLFLYLVKKFLKGGHTTLKDLYRAR